MRRSVTICVVAVVMFMAVAPADANTLIADFINDRVIEVDESGTIVWAETGVSRPWDVERLANGNTLIVDGFGRVIEIDTDGTIVWQKTGLYCVDAERLGNGNTLIADYGNPGVIEVDSSGTIVWEKTGVYPYDVERLANGNTLIVDRLDQRVIEVDNAGTVVWLKIELEGLTDAERLDNGNTLIAQDWRVIEVDSSGTIVWELTDVHGAVDVERLSNGNTLITEYSWHRVIEVDSSGTIVWEQTGLYGPRDAEDLGEPPIDEQIAKVITIKLQLIRQINALLEQEQHLTDLLNDWLASGDYGDLSRGEIVTPRQKIHSAMQHQEQSRKDLQKSIEKLQDALWLLGFPVGL